MSAGQTQRDARTLWAAEVIAAWLLAGVAILAAAAGIDLTQDVAA